MWRPSCSGFSVLCAFGSENQIKAQAGEAAHGTKKLETHTAENITLKVPDIATQRRVSAIVSPCDDLIENNRQRIALLEETARLLYREWFINLRFPGHERARFIDGLPEGWKWCVLGDIVETNHDSYRAKDLPEYINYIDIAAVNRGRIADVATIPAAEAPGRARRKVQDGDTIWSNVRPNLRAYALIQSPDEFDVVSTGFTVLVPVAVPFTWLYLLVTTDHFIGHLVNHATGAGYPAARPDDFIRGEIILPTHSVLDHFHEMTAMNFRQIHTLEQQNQKLAQARDLLLPRLMSGEIAV